MAWPMRKSFVVLGFGLVSMLTASVAPAQSAPAPCSVPPPQSDGHVIGKINSIDADGVAKISFPAGLTGRTRPKANDDVHLLTCDGVVVKSGDTDVDSVSGDTLTARFRRLASPAGYVGQYVAIDNGYESATPLMAEASISNLDRDEENLRITIAAGEEDGVFSGADGRFVLTNKKVVPFKVNASSRSASTTAVRGDRDDFQGARVLLRVTTPKCFPPPPIAADAYQRWARSSAAPPGYVVAKGTFAGGTLTVDKGTDDKIVASEAYLVSTTLTPIRLTDVTAKQSKAKVMMGGFMMTSAKVLVPTLGGGARCKP